ncbi:MAG TPA: FAD-dependent oxidoreductase [Desulfobulbus sp.]|nr:FAD-dependent oxidoreductase [Desulfobulbus sp.]
MNVILGAGLSGLTAGLILTRAGCRTTILEQNNRVGGLARTIRCGEFRFDLGGHRFLTDNRLLLALLADLLAGDLLTVPRKSRICISGRYINYPLTPLNAFFGLGPARTGSILLDYGREKIRNLFFPREVNSLEDWVVSRFGRTMFELYFKAYSEKVWGIRCDRISRDWVARRIDNLSLARFVRHAFLRFGAGRVKTLSDTFLYPRQGIGQLADRLHEGIVAANRVRTSAVVEQVVHSRDRIVRVEYTWQGTPCAIQGEHYISSIPLTRLLAGMVPRPPADVRAAAATIRYRALVIVALFLDRRRMTDLSWLYFPGRDIPFGRIHEPVNWSPDLAPAGRSHVVAEYFCDRNDTTWQAPDAAMAELTVFHLQRLGLLRRQDVVGSRVLRIPHAYPVFDLHYRRRLRVISDYLAGFANLQLVGRSGLFSYLNMDQAMESGMAAAERIMQRSTVSGRSRVPEPAAGPLALPRLVRPDPLS